MIPMSWESVRMKTPLLAVHHFKKKFPNMNDESTVFKKKVEDKLKMAKQTGYAHRRGLTLYSSGIPPLLTDLDNLVQSYLRNVSNRG